MFYLYLKTCIDHDYVPTEQAIVLNEERISERLRTSRLKKDIILDK